MAFPLDAAPPPLGPGLCRIVVGRPPGGWRDRARAYRIRVDDVSVQRVRPGQYVVFDLPSGHYAVDARIDWSGSEEVGVDVFSGSVVHLRVEPSGSVLQQFWQALTPRGYLRLSVVEPPAAMPPTPAPRAERPQPPLAPADIAPI